MKSVLWINCNYLKFFVIYGYVTNGFAVMVQMKF